MENLFHVYRVLVLFINVKEIFLNPISGYLTCTVSIAGALPFLPRKKSIL